jgi:hypothetical protein
MSYGDFNERLRQAFEQGKQAAQQDRVHSFDVGLKQTAHQLRQEFNQLINRNASGVRGMVDKKMASIDQRLSDLANIAQALSATTSGDVGGGGVIRIEDIPGRRVPYTLLVDIAIGANTTSIREASVTISQEGPFVAVKRMATFQSAFEFQTTDEETGAIARFAGRSFGRYRPVHSAWDVNDSQHNAVADTADWYLAAQANPGTPIGTVLPSATLGMPSNMSSFRSMEFDGRISVINAGSSYPRQNISVPSAFWSGAINSPWDLGALDFFERGEVLTVSVQPTHVNNPPAGNVTSLCVFPDTADGGVGWPFLDGQYDAHEGICTPNGSTLGNRLPRQSNVLATDAIARLPDGILTLGWEGYRIIQPVGPVS